MEVNKYFSSMSTPDLSSIPLPVEARSTVAVKKTAHEMLQEALRDHNISSSQESNLASKHSSSELGPALSAGGDKARESSQSIVDELFKDFIAKKFSSASRDMKKAASETRVRSSADEISKILDMEIKTIRSNTESKEKLTDQKDHKSNSSSKQSKLYPTSSSAKVKRGQSEDVLSAHCGKETVQSEPLINTTLVSSDKPTLISEGENGESAVQCQPLITDSQHVATAAGTIGAFTQSTTLAPPCASQLRDVPQPRATDSCATVKRNVMLPAPLAKKMMPPKVFGVKLSTESLSLITSTDRIDRDGRLWEEGEVRSSHSEGSEKEGGESDSEPDGFPSDSGSVNSNNEDWKTQGSKHKKKHKHKHKKKRKKSTKERDKDSKKDRHRESKDKDKERNKEKGTDIAEKDNDKHETLTKDDKGNDKPTRSSKERDDSRSEDVKEVEKPEIDQSKRDREKRSRDKDKSHDREHKGSRRRDKDGDKKRKRSHSRSRSPKRHKRSKSRSRSHSRSPKRHGSWSSAGSSRYSEWDARRYSDDPSKFSSRDHSRSRSRSKERSCEKRKRSRDSRSHERDRSKEENDRDLRVQIDKAKLRKIAIANALQNMKAGQGPQVDLTLVKSGGKSVEELTEFCKRISEKGKAKASSDDGHTSDEDVTKNSDDEEMPIHHPFKVKDASATSIVMNIRNAKQLPVLTPSEKQAQLSALRLTFPVSSGSHHRASEWVPVVKAITEPIVNPIVQVASEVPPPSDQTKVDNIFPDPVEAQKIDIGSIISERLQAVRKLQENPYDIQALSKMHQVQEQASKWATSKHLPGQFLGSTGAQVLSQEQLIGDRRRQAWAKKTQISHAAPVHGGIGMFLLQKMGWKQGEGLGKNNEGSKVPLMLDIKVDRRGLTTAAENPRHRIQAAAASVSTIAAASVPRAKDLSNKHPVSGLMELCNRRRWGPPMFTVVSESGPDHKKNFMFKVRVNNVEYQPAMPSSNKKTAKALCAAICLQEMGLLPRDAPLNI